MIVKRERRGGNGSKKERGKMIVKRERKRTYSEKK